MEKGLKNLQSAGRNALRREKMSLASVIDDGNGAGEVGKTENSMANSTVLDDSGIAEADMDDDGDPDESQEAPSPEQRNAQETTEQS
jgi:hypothetical protein